MSICQLNNQDLGCPNSTLYHRNGSIKETTEYIIQVKQKQKIRMQTLTPIQHGLFHELYVGSILKLP